MSTLNAIYKNIDSGVEIFRYGVRYVFVPSFRANEREKYRQAMDRLKRSEDSLDESLKKFADVIDNIKVAQMEREKRLMVVLEKNPDIQPQVDAMLLIGINKYDAINICYNDFKKNDKRSD
jgi:exonuclease VII small subunit